MSPDSHPPTEHLVVFKNQDAAANAYAFLAKAPDTHDLTQTPGNGSEWVLAWLVGEPPAEDDSEAPSKLCHVRIAELESALKRIAHRFATHATPSDELYNQMVSKLLKRAESDPDFFLSNTDSYLEQYAKFRAIEYLRSTEQMVTRFCPVDLDAAPEPDAALPAAFITAHYDLASEVEMWDTLSGLMNHLTPTHRETIELIYSGYSAAEIAALRGINRSRVYQHITAIREHLEKIEQMI